MSSSNTASARREIITDTGWRIVGKATKLATAPGISVGSALRSDDILFATRLGVQPRKVGTDVIDLVVSVLSGALASYPDRIEPLSRDGSLSVAYDRFAAIEWDTDSWDGRWAADLTWTHPHPVVRGVPCTTHVSLTGTSDLVEMKVHVGASGGPGAVNGFVGAGQARPAFLVDLSRVAKLSFGSDRIQTRTLSESDIDRFVRNVLLGEYREQPVAVLAPLDHDRRAAQVDYVVPPHQLADELLGLAPLYVIDRHDATFRLSDSMGDRRLSAYWGALRIYLPDFSCADSGMKHPLLMHERLEDPVERAGLIGHLGREARLRVPVSSAVALLREARQEAVAAAATPAQAAVDSAPEAEVDDTVSSEPERSSEPAPRAATLRDDERQMLAEQREDTARVAQDMAQVVTQTTAITEILQSLLGTVQALSDDVARLKTATVVRGGNTQSVERRLGQVEALIRTHFETPDESLAARPLEAEEIEEEAEDGADLTLTDVVQHAAAEYSDALLILDGAVASAGKSPYQDVHRVATYLRAMAEVSARRQEGRLGMSLRDAFAEAGVDYRSGIAKSTSKKNRLQYLAKLPDGRTVECHEHIALGAGTYDPRHVLRIYFTSRAPDDPRFVIAHVGRHFDVKTTT